MIARRTMIAGMLVVLVLTLPGRGVVAGPPPAGPGGAEVTAIAAAVGDTVNYQGRLTDPATGNALDGTYTMRFELYTAETGGSPVWDSGSLSVPVDNGLFNVQLDVDQGDFNGQALWLRIQVGGQWLTPRREILPAPYALSLRPGAEITGSVSGNDALQVRNDSSTMGSTGVFGWAYATSGQTFGVWGTSRSTAGTGVYGNADAESGTTYGVWGVSRSSSGRGVYGWATAASGTSYGVYGESASTAGRGVYGGATANSGVTHGVQGQSASTSGRGVWGYATATSGDTYGVLGESASTAGRGVTGLASASSGSTHGVKGLSASTAGMGVGGYATATSGTTWGVHGEAVSPAGYGVYGEAPQYGVYGEATRTSGSALGVFGVTSSAGGYGVHGVALATSGETRGVSGIVQSPDGVAGYFRVQGAEGLGLRVESPGTLIVAYDGDPLDRRFRVTNVGNVYADGTFNPGGADLAEMLPAVEGLEPGDVLVIGSDGKLTLSKTPYATNVAGVYSTKPGFVGGSDEDGINAGKAPLAVVGIAPVKVSAENGPIAPGDLLTTSGTPGHAMKATEPKLGTILGKALAELKSGAGVIDVLIILQ